MSSPAPRLPRFQRRKPGSQPMQITPRDIEILKLVARHRFLRSSHLLTLVDGSRQQVLRRLQRLFHHGYLERPRAQLDYYHEGGSRPMVYGLGSRGAGRLRRDLDMPFAAMGWPAKNGNPGRVFLEHALLASDVMVLVELACRRTPGVRLLTATELPAQPNGRPRPEPLRWFVNLDAKNRLGVVPDGVFGLEYVSAGGKPEQAWFFLEADRATMPVTRRTLGQSSVLRKLLAYETTWVQDLHRTKLGLQRFRVLTVTSSAERVQTMLKACRELRRGKGLFLFGDLASLAASADVLKQPWLGASESGGTLLP